MAQYLDVTTSPGQYVSVPHISAEGKTLLEEAPNIQTNGAIKKIRPPLPKYKHLLAVHTQNKPSCLSTGATPAPNFDGFRNLILLVLLVSNLRLMLENLNKYGVLICIACHDYRKKDLLSGAVLFLMVPLHLFIALWIERVAATQATEDRGRGKKYDDISPESKSKTGAAISHRFWLWIAFAHGINATLNLVVATYTVYFNIHHPGIGTVCLLHAVIVWLKVCSYAFTNRDLRHAYLTSAGPVPEMYRSCPYPKNITLSNLTYYWWAPTLVYQPVYPRTDRIRWLFVLKRAAEFVGLSIAIWVASAQYAVPLLYNSMRSISAGDMPSMAERLMKLSSISLFCWLAGFFAIFQSGLNLLAEIMRFADREFYKDWWNSASIKTYWTLWNRPVYQFMKRHIFMPLIGRGVPPTVASIIVFVFSGLLHELLVGVPTHNIIGVAFLGMMFQIPLMAITEILTSIKGLDGKTIGNVIFWVSFVLVGQPLAVMLYFFAWQAKYGSVNHPDYAQVIARAK